jgi:hypothetical protein
MSLDRFHEKHNCARYIVNVNKLAPRDPGTPKSGTCKDIGKASLQQKAQCDPLAVPEAPVTRSFPSTRN